MKYNFTTAFSFCNFVLLAKIAFTRSNLLMSIIGILLCLSPHGSNQLATLTVNFTLITRFIAGSNFK